MTEDQKTIDAVTWRLMYGLYIGARVRTKVGATGKISGLGTAPGDEPYNWWYVTWDGPFKLSRGPYRDEELELL